MRFYTNISLRGKNVLYRGWENGMRVQEAIPFSPTLYIKSSKPTDFTTIHGLFVEPILFETVNEARDFVDQYKEVSNFEVYGNTSFVYQYLYTEFPKEVEYNHTQLRTAVLDIETSCDGGFPSVDAPTERIIGITLTISGKTFVLGLGAFALPDVEYECFTKEEDLLTRFVEIWRHQDPDILTGWNVRFFDIPYLVARMEWLQEGWSKQLSPWGQLRETVVNRMGRDQKAYTIAGVATLDYLEMYQKFTYTNQESFSLNNISKVELGEEKLSYGKYDTLQEFYTNDFQRFMEYNAKDVELVCRLEEKLKLLELVVAMAYSAHVNLEDVFSQVKTWDAIIHHHLMGKGIVVPPKKTVNKDTQYAGAYVKDPIVGIHDWVVSYDLNSLYPMLIAGYNISPETVERNPVWKRGSISSEAILSRDNGDAVTSFTDPAEYLNSAKTHDVSVAANGMAFSRKRQGFLPELMEKMYEERKRYKNLMINAQMRLEELLPDSPAHLRKSMEFEVSKYKNFQMVRKIQLNSAYGAVGNEWFRFYDDALAESITLSGQLSIQWIANRLNRFLNKILKTEDQDYVIASDTDSVYLRLGEVVAQSFKGERTSDAVVTFLNDFSCRVMEPFINKQFAELATTMNAYKNKMMMGREVIAEKGVWTAKKRYMLSVWDTEGVRYTKPKLKIMGIETSRSSTPGFVRKALKQAVEMVLLKDEATLQEFVRVTKQEFSKLPVEDMAFPRSVSGMKRYSDSGNIYTKSTPIAVKAALLHNNLVKTLKLGKKYRAIGEGEKMRFLLLRTPNPIHQHVIGFVTALPPEFEIHKYVDWEEQFRKSFMEPLRVICTAVGWTPEHVTTLDSLFA